MIQNLSTGLLTKYFAKWSTPYQSPYSNTSRILTPISDIINSGIENSSNLFSMRYRNSKSTVYEDLYIIDRVFAKNGLWSEISRIQNKDGTYLTTGKTKLRNVGHVAHSNWNQFPVTGVSLERSNRSWTSDTFVSIVGKGEHKISHRFVSQNRIYIKPLESDVDGYVTINGHDANFNRIKESIFVDKNKVYETSKKFISITSIASPRKISVSNYVDCSIDHYVYSRNTLPNRIANNDGVFIDPMLRLDDKTLYIYDADSMSNDPMHQLDLPYTPKYLFMTEASDLYVVDDSKWLSTLKPSLNYEYSSKDSSTNNNMFIYLEDYEHRQGSLIRCRVMAHDIIVRASGPYIRISVKNGDNTFYIDKEGNLNQDDNTWINGAESANIINISIWCDNTDPYIFTVTDQDGKTYSTMLSQLESNHKNIIGDVTSMYIYDSDLYIVYDAELFLLKPLRHIYKEYDGRRLSLDSNYKDLNSE